MWDLLGRKLEVPVYRLLGYKRAYPKTAYASVLFGASAKETFAKVSRIAQRGFRAIKLGWGPFGQLGVKEDKAQIFAAREAAGRDCALMVDAGTIWANSLPSAPRRLPALKAAGVLWLEEPFSTREYGVYKKLAVSRPKIALAAGEGSHNPEMAKNLMDYGGIKFIQIDTGRVGGITSGKAVADYARQRGVTYVNHTFTSNLSLSASLQPFAGMEEQNICEYPLELSPLARDLTVDKIEPDKDGFVTLPEKPGLGINVDRLTIKKFNNIVSITINQHEIFATPRV
jgi:L-alanine-DL-glutamate epimerase-like enolase superfamily enzyme